MTVIKFCLIVSIYKQSQTLAHGFLAQSKCLHMPRGTASPQPLRISRSLAMAELSVKSFALFFVVKGV